MRHLTDHLDESALLDLAEGTRSEPGAAHLAVCERCRGQVEELRSAMRTAEDASVPEPSPLFWEHLSARIAEAVAEETSAASVVAPAGWATRVWKWQVVTAALVAAAVVLAVAVNRRPVTDANSAQSAAAPAPAAATINDLTPSLENDPSLSFIADLASDLDWDDAVEAGLTGGADIVERVVQDMSDDELRELRRVLQEEMGRPGA
jgi:hypothetical protein